jgi:hypothetical protein
LLPVTASSESINYKEETCNHLLLNIEEYASGIKEEQDIEKAINEYDNT